MRVISGYLKRRKILVPEKKGDLRPTRDMIREAVFDVLRGWVAGKRVLDLFAGTGALGIEAVSNGALEAVFVESERDAVGIIRKNIEALGIADICSVKKGEVEKIIHGFEGEKFDLILADPPYDYPKNKITAVLESILNFGVIGGEGIIVIEHKRESPLPGVPGLTVYKEKFYGKSAVSYIKAGQSEE